MTTVAHHDLHEFICAILVGAGVPPAEADTVARLNTAANLAGHDSHGVAMVPGYVRDLAAGTIRPGARFEVVRETATTTVVDGHGGFGYVVTQRALDITIAKATQHGVGVTTVRGQSHVGRLAAYPIQAAAAGLIGIAMASGRGGRWVTPYGGRTGQLGTNPLSIAVPSNLHGPFAFDMSTSAVAGGRVRVAQRAGEPIPTGWIVDAAGEPTTDPDQLDQGGALLPFGGEQAHKGYALSATVEVLAGILPGLGFTAADAPHGNGCFLACIAVDAFYDREQFEREVAEFAERLRTSPPAAGFDAVRYPGEASYRTELARRRDGIPLAEPTWRELCDLAAAYGVPLPPYA